MASAHEDWCRASAAHESGTEARYERMLAAADSAHAAGDDDLADRRHVAAREILRGDRGEWGLCGPDTHPEEVIVRAEDARRRALFARVTHRKLDAADASSWAVFLDGTPVATGLARPEIAAHVTALWATLTKEMHR